MRHEGHFGRISNRETWSQAIHVVDEAGNDADISAATIAVAVRLKSAAPGDTQQMEASVGDGVTIVSPIFTFQFEETEMDDLDPGLYDVGITITISSFTTQLIKGTVFIEDGIVD